MIGRWLDDELGRWISKPFDIHRPTHRLWLRLDNEHLIVLTKFITGEEVARWKSSPRWEPSLTTKEQHFEYQGYFESSRQRSSEWQGYCGENPSRHIEFLRTIDILFSDTCILIGVPFLMDHCSHLCYGIEI